uniref:Uncharacterized protein n=1 Tax=Kalanchoe fedtschenkoi TaxID=63787 RepID=A0A7N1A8D6_KALFE
MGESPLNSKRGSIQDKDSRLDGGNLLSYLQAIYEKLQNRYDYSKDLPTYLNYCRDVIFVGTGLSNDDEKTITEEFWDIYHDKQVMLLFMLFFNVSFNLVLIYFGSMSTTFATTKQLQLFCRIMRVKLYLKLNIW